MKRAAQYLGCALLILVAGLAVFTSLAPKFGWRVDTVLSSSMEPSLKVGGVVVTRPVEPEQVKVGDSILFHSPLDGRLTTHRVISLETTSSLHFRTKGDANEDPDPFIVPAENVVGRVWLHVPYLGYTTQFVKSRLGFVLTLYLPGITIIILEGISIWHVLDEQEKEKNRRGRSAHGNRQLQPFQATLPALCAGTMGLPQPAPAGNSISQREARSDAPIELSVSQPSATKAISPAISMLSPGQQRDVDSLVAEIMNKVTREVMGGPGPGVKD